MTTTHATLVGGPTLLLEWAGRNLLTDPTFDPPGSHAGAGATLHKLRGPALAADELGPLDGVLLSHDQHADNLDTAGRGVLGTVPLVLSTPAAAARLEGVTGLQPWDVHELGGGDGARVTAVPALHGAAGAEAVAGPVTGFVLEAAEAPVVYVSGDNASVAHVAEVAERFRVDVAVLFVGGARVGLPVLEPLTLDASLAVAAARLLPTARLLLVHHTDWAHLAEPLEAVAAALVADGHGERLVPLERGARTRV